TASGRCHYDRVAEYLHFVNTLWAIFTIYITLPWSNGSAPLLAFLLRWRNKNCTFCTECLFLQRTQVCRFPSVRCGQSCPNHIPPDFVVDRWASIMASATPSASVR